MVVGCGHVGGKLERRRAWNLRGLADNKHACMLGAQGDALKLVLCVRGEPTIAAEQGKCKWAGHTDRDMETQTG